MGNIALEQGLSPRTIEAYERDLMRFAEYAEVKGVAVPAAITATMLREFVYHLKDLGLAPASIRRSVSAIRTYFRFLIGDGIVSADPDEQVERIRPYVELGFRHLVFHAPGPDQTRFLRLFAEQVAPKLRAAFG